jgi:hypothetical protein
MIAPDFLASLRRRHRAELVLVLVQLEQRCPGHWLTLHELAEQLGTDRATLNRSMRKLERLGLIERATISNYGGTWLWWVATHEGDAPAADAEPAWVLRDATRRGLFRVPLRERWTWAAKRGIPRQTMRSFLSGGQVTLRERWQLVSTPMDCYEL